MTNFFASDEFFADRFFTDDYFYLWLFLPTNILTDNCFTNENIYYFLT